MGVIPGSVGNFDIQFFNGLVPYIYIYIYIYIGEHLEGSNKRDHKMVLWKYFSFLIS